MTGGAALAEVADKVKDENEPEPPQQDSKEKSGRGMFDKIANKLKTHQDDEEKPVDEREIETKEAEEPSREPPQPAVAIGDTRENHDTGTAPTGLISVDAGVIAIGGIEDERAPEEPVARDVVADEQIHPDEDAKDELEQDGDAKDQVEQDEDDGEVGRVGKTAAAAAGIAALGAVVAAGAIGAEHHSRHEDEEKPEVSSLPVTDEDEPEHERAPLVTVTSAEHTGHYNFAGPSSDGVGGRPNLERHISTIQDSSDEADDEDDDLDDDDDEPAFIGRPMPTEHLEESAYTDEPAPDQPAPPSFPTETVEKDTVDREPPAAVETTLEAPADVEPSRETPATVETSREAPTAAEPTGEVEPLTTRGALPASLLSALPKDDQGNIVIANKDASPDDLHLVVAPKPYQPSESEPAAPAPAVKTGPGDDNKNQTTQAENDKDQKGVRGFFNKLRGKNKNENRLQKTQPGSSASEKSIPAAPRTTSNETEDSLATPVTTTSAGKEDEQHVGVDGQIGDSKHVSGLGGDPRPASPSSFKRHDEDLDDLDDVSSSGVEEEDIERGRGGRIAKKLSLGKDSEKQTSNENEEQFEEARDHFDETLAPPPAFAGQAKSESPVRETRFQEQL